jgi:hypothetical protein
MLSLAFALFASLHSPAAPNVVTAMHGTRTEWVFTRPVVVRGCIDDEGAPCSKARERRVAAIRARLSAGDDGGPIRLDTERPDVWDIESTRERGDCAWYGPRLDGTRVQVCNGSVVAMSDASGNVLAYPGSVR